MGVEISEISREQYDLAREQHRAAEEVMNAYNGQRELAFKARWDRYMAGKEVFSDAELIYSSHSRCRQCGAGLAYPKDCGIRHAWDCSRSLNGSGEKGHESFAFMYYEIKSEDQPSANGATTRPAVAAAEVS